jgi:signal transduction histidine kinase/CheY-like chemotaxis protein
MFYGKTLKYIFIISATLAVLFPLVNFYFIFPSFSKLLVANTEEEAARVAKNLSPIILNKDNEIQKPSDFDHEVEKAKKQFKLNEIKVFSKWGEIVYSTNHTEIGQINKKRYFHEIVASGNPYTKVVKKGTKTLEDRIVPVDVVETYVPIMKGGEFIGAFEIYYDITVRNQMLNKVVFRSSLLSFSLMFIFFVAVLMISLRSDRTIDELQAVELAGSYGSPLYLMLIVALSIFVAEAIVMCFLNILPPLSQFGEAVLDASFLVMLVSPVFYFFILRPLMLHITKRKQAERELEKARDDLEKRVYIRTSELAEANVQLKNDIKERKKLEDQLRHSQKMEAVGTLTGGIAHEFNNILTAIIGCGELLHEEMDKDTALRTYVDVIQVSSERAANLTKSLLAYSRKQITHLEPIHINRITIKVEKLLSRIIGENIKLETILTEEDATVLADSAQIEQVLMNLATNSRDAMPNGGTLTITTEVVEMKNEFITAHGFGKPGKYVILSVTDTGEGIAKDTKERIFEPFFTTKDVGKGTGLGLSMVYGILQMHKGYINVSSEDGKGTTFNLYLPVHLPSFREEAEEIETEVAELKPIIGSETILYAEDDTEVRRLFKASLEKFGYNVIEAIDGEDAQEKFMEHQDKVDLILFDMVLPKKNGREVYDEIKKIKPDIKALFISGYTEDEIMNKHGIFDDLHFISKPVSPKDLAGKVRECLDSKNIK